MRQHASVAIEETQIRGCYHKKNYEDELSGSMGMTGIQHPLQFAFKSKSLSTILGKN
jgi:hypothetical protein